MELLDKLKLNSHVVKIRDDYEATFPNKSGTIALTSDIPDSYTKTESDGKYVVFGSNTCGDNFLNVEFNENTASIKIGDDDQFSTFYGCGFIGYNVNARCISSEYASIGGCSFTSDSECVQIGSPLYLTNSCSRIKIDPIPKDSSLENSYLGFSNNEVLVELPLNKDGTIALTSDIPDSYTKEETDGKYVKFGENICGNQFIEINVNAGQLKVGCINDNCTLIYGGGIETDSIETNELSVGCVFGVEKGSKTYFGEQNVIIDTDAEISGNLYLRNEGCAKLEVKLSVSESCGEASDDSLLCFSNKNNIVSLPLDKSGTIALTSDLANFVPATYKHGTYNKETYEVDEPVTFKNDVYVGSYAWIKTDVCNPVYMGGLNFATRSDDGENSSVRIANIGGDGGIDYSWFKSPPHIGDSDVVAVVSQIPDISGKADRCSTLAGYGITDAYTKTEVDKKIPTDYLPVIALDANGDLVSDTGNSPASYKLHEGFFAYGPLKTFSQTDFIGPVTFEIYPESTCSFVFTKETQFVTKKYVDDSICTSTQHLKTKSYQSVETTGDKWTITLDSEYSSAPFFQVFNSENSVVYPEVKFTAPSTLELTFEGKEGIGLGEFTAVVSVPFTTTITPNESYVSIGTAQGISGKKNFTTVPTINSVDIATVDNLSTTENSIRSYVDTEISAKVASVYRFKGDSAYASLPANAQVGDVYNLTTASGEYNIGDNVAWTGSKWDKLAATVDLSGYLTTSSASSTYLTISSANSTYATKDKTIDTSVRGEYSILSSLNLADSSACLYAPFISAGGSIIVGGSRSENDKSYFYGPVEFTNTVSVSELEIDSLSLETLEIGNEINVNGIAVSESISKLNAKTGSLEYVLPAKDPIGGVVEWEVTINTDLTKTVKCPPNVIVCDITGERYKYVVCDVEWDGANKIYIKFDNNYSIEDNQFKAYITNIQLQ